MIIKVRNRGFDAELEPIAIYFTEEEVKVFAAQLADGSCEICFGPKTITDQEARDFMNDIPIISKPTTNEAATDDGDEPHVRRIVSLQK